MIPKKNWLTTLGGVMVGLGGLPMLVTASHIAFPLWWNNCQFPLVLVGLIGGVVLGVAAKGQDEHSTHEEVKQSTIAKESEKQADQPKGGQ